MCEQAVVSAPKLRLFLIEKFFISHTFAYKTLNNNLIINLTLDGHVRRSLVSSLVACKCTNKHNKKDASPFAINSFLQGNILNISGSFNNPTH